MSLQHVGECAIAVPRVALGSNANSRILWMLSKVTSVRTCCRQVTDVRGHCNGALPLAVEVLSQATGFGRTACNGEHSWDFGRQN